MCYCDFDMPTVYAKSVRKARKQYRCNECGAAIQVGHAYQYVFGVWDGNADFHRTCIVCVDLADWAESAAGHQICWSHGNMLDEIQECLFECDAPKPGVRFGWVRRRYGAEIRARIARRRARAAA